MESVTEEAAAVGIEGTLELNDSKSDFSKMELNDHDHNHYAFKPSILAVASVATAAAATTAPNSNANTATTNRRSSRKGGKQDSSSAHHHRHHLVPKSEQDMIATTAHLPSRSPRRSPRTTISPKRTSSNSPKRDNRRSFNAQSFGIDVPLTSPKMQSNRHSVSEGISPGGGGSGARLSPSLLTKSPIMATNTTTTTNSSRTRTRTTTPKTKSKSMSNRRKSGMSLSPRRQNSLQGPLLLSSSSTSSSPRVLPKDAVASPLSVQRTLRGSKASSRSSYRRAASERILRSPLSDKSSARRKSIIMESTMLQIGSSSSSSLSNNFKVPFGMDDNDDNNDNIHTNNNDGDDDDKASSSSSDEEHEKQLRQPRRKKVPTKKPSLKRNSSPAIPCAQHPCSAPTYTKKLVPLDLDLDLPLESPTTTSTNDGNTNKRSGKKRRSKPRRASSIPLQADLESLARNSPLMSPSRRRSSLGRQSSEQLRSTATSSSARTSVSLSPKPRRKQIHNKKSNSNGNNNSVEDMNASHSSMEHPLSFVSSRRRSERGGVGGSRSSSSINLELPLVDKEEYE